jgi:hypothetical protein
MSETRQATASSDDGGVITDRTKTRDDGSPLIRRLRRNAAEEASVYNNPDGVMPLMRLADLLEGRMYAEAFKFYGSIGAERSSVPAPLRCVIRDWEYNTSHSLTVDQSWVRIQSAELTNRIMAAEEDLAAMRAELDALQSQGAT